MAKLIKDGMVAVVICPGYGAGFSTWYNEVYPMDKDMAEAVLAGSENLVITAFRKMVPEDDLVNDYRELDVVWVPVGTKFIIREYDGHESIQTFDDIDWMTA